MTEHRKAYMRSYLREWRQKNRDKMKAYDVKWRMADPEAAHESDLRKYKKHNNKRGKDPEYRAKAVERVKLWAKHNPEHWKLLRLDTSHRRRARKLQTSIGPVDFTKIIIRANGICGICQEQIKDNKSEFDHIIPLAKGGSHTENNLQLAHAVCNRKKNSRFISIEQENVYVPNIRRS